VTTHAQAHAEAYASLGIVVAPMWGGLKALHSSRSNPQRAILGDSFDLATVGSLDVEVIASWYERDPAAGVAVVCGARSGLFIVDVDPRNGGDTAWESWLVEREEEGLTLPDVLPLVSTPGGGFHLWVKLPSGADARAMTLGIPGVDIRGSEGWAAAPPSVVDGAGQYSWVRPGQLIEVPWLFERLRPRRRVRTSPEGGSASDAGSDTAPFDLERGLAGEVPPGEQHDYLVGAAASLRARRTDRRTALAILESIVSHFEAGDPNKPWNPTDDALEVWSWAEDLPEGTGGPELTDVQRSWRPIVLEGGGAGGEAGEEYVDRGGEAGDGFIHIEVGAQDIELRTTDYANAQDLIKLAGHRVRWTPQHGWYRWNPAEGRWQVDQGVQVHGDVIDLVNVLRARLPGVGEDDREVLQRRINRLESTGGLKACLEIAQHMVEVDAADFDSKPELLNCLNGTVELLSGRLREHRPEDLLTRRAPVNFDLNARSAELERVLYRLLPDEEVRTCLLEILGGSLVGGNRARLMLVVYGPTTTGKTTLMGLVGTALGDYAGAANPSLFRGAMEDRPRPDILTLMPRRLAILEEAGSSWDLHADTVKKLTGGTPVSARAMHSNAMITKVPDFTLVIVSNEVPSIKGSDDAIKRRFVSIYMGERLVPGEEDPTLRWKLEQSEEVLGAMLALLVRACVAVNKPVLEGGGGGMPRLPQKVIEQTAEALSDVDDVPAFLQELVDDGLLVWHPEWFNNSPGGAGLTGGWSSCVRTSDLHAAYMKWVKERGSAVSQRDRLGPKQFHKRLEAEGWQKVRSNGSRWAGWEFRQFGQLPTWRPE
jgi:putative DNA primase/helicase